MVDGLAQVHGQRGLTAVVNTGDDGDFYGLRVCPDLDICTYVLAGVVAERGWGYAARHLPLPGGPRHLRPRVVVRARRPRPGDPHPPHPAPARGRRPDARSRPRSAPAWASRRRVLPMTDDAGAHPHHHRRPGRGPSRSTWCATGPPRRSTRIEMLGIDSARPAPGLLEAIADAERDRDLPLEPGGLDRDDPRRAGRARGARRPPRGLRGGQRRSSAGAPVEGPADRFLRGAGHDECSATQMARIYADVAGDLRAGRARRRPRRRRSRRSACGRCSPTS